MQATCPILRLDHLEFYVGNARQAASFYTRCFGFTPTAYRGLETGERKTASYVLHQGEICFVLSAALSSDHAIAQSVLRHGDTIAVIAFLVTDVGQIYQQASEQGARGVIPPTEQADEQGVLRYAAIQGYGDTLIKFVDRSQYRGAFAPGFRACLAPSVPDYGLQRVDHIVGNVEQGAMNDWVDFFSRTLGLQLLAHFDDRAISTEYSALMSKVLQNETGTIKLPINEPAVGRCKSQIEEYLEYHQGPGIQHIALTTDNIAQTVQRLRQAGVEFLPIPPTYYTELADWVHQLDLPLQQLAELGILIDRDGDGYLLQLFTKPLGDRPTLFFEIIERRGCQGFGAGNFKLLFVALEQEQAARGNL